MKPYYERNGITIYHGDCREVLPTVAGNADLLCTDPPYSFGSAARHKEYHAGAAVIQGLTLAGQSVHKNAAALIMTAASGRGFSMALECMRPREFKRLLVWTKTFVNSPVAGPWRWDIVPILAFGPVCVGRPQHSSHITTPGHKTAGCTTHPAEVPIAVARWMTEPLVWGLLLDPFCGSGSFLVAAQMLGRQAIGIEIEEQHCEIAARRLDQDVLPLES